jgi:hypothetical protein
MRSNTLLYAKKHAHVKLQCLNSKMLIRFMSSLIGSRDTGAHIVTDQDTARLAYIQAGSNLKWKLKLRSS